MNLPQEFCVRMKRMLGEEYEAFLQTYQEPRRFGLRVNTLKISAEEFVRLAPFHLRGIPWTDNGFYYEKEDDPARHPFYYAGLYYLQEPSAMMPAAALPVRPGERVLDLCAAPGGKATALAAKLQGRGLLVANEISPSRVKALLKNLEAAGAVNSVVTNAAPYRLAEQYPESFDKILVDAPCSGEGMFRKDMASAKAWSLDKVEACAKVQREITLQAVKMLRPGGLLLYSTCTFSPEENEGTIVWLLSQCPELELADLPAGIRGTGIRPVDGWCKKADLPAGIRGTGIRPVDGWCKKADLPAGIRATDICQSRCPELAESPTKGRGAKTGTSAASVELRGWPEFAALLSDPDMPGSRGATFQALQDAGAAKLDLSVLTKCIRIFPHRMEGEGHFLALLAKRGNAGACFAASERGGSGRIAGSGRGAGTGGIVESGRIAGSGRSAGSGRIAGSGKSAGSGRIAGSGEDLAALEVFFRDVRMDRSWEKLDVRGGHVFALAESPRAGSHLPFLRNGLYLGELRKGRFEPSQALAMALGPGEYASVLDFGPEDPRVRRYLCGETIETEGLSPARPSGWQLVCVCGYPLGWGKLVSGTLKNKYHPGWRMRT